MLAGLQVAEIVALLAQVASFSFLVTYGLVHVALIVFRRVNPDAYDPDFTLPSILYPAVPVLGIVMAGVIISQMRTTVILVGSGIVALGVVWYVGYARSRVVEDGLLSDALSTTVEPGDTPFETIKGVFTRMGTGDVTDETDPYRVVVPIANPATQGQLLRLAAATARAHADEGPPELVAVHVTEASRSPNRNVESDRVTEERDLLEVARQVAAEIGIDLVTRSVVADAPGEVIVDTIQEIEAEQTVIGWQGATDESEGRVFGSTLDPVIKRAPCDVTLMEFEQDTIGRPVALVDPGPHAPTVAQRAVDFATVDGTKPTLLNVQEATDDLNPVNEGQRAIEWIAQQAGLDSDEYEAEVVVTDDVPTALVDAVDAYGTVCVGLSERSDVERLKFGSTARHVSLNAAGNVGVIRGRKLFDVSEGNRAVTNVIVTDEGE